MRNIALLVSSSLALIVSSCGSGSSNFLQLGSSNDTCSLQIDQNTWQVSSSPNQNVFPNTNNFATVQASTVNCGSVFAGSNNIQIKLKLTSTASGFTGQQLALVSVSVGSKNLIESDTSNNFASGILNGIVVDSRVNSNWKPPFADPGFMTFTFQIPNSVLGQMEYYPSGLIYIDQVN